MDFQFSQHHFSGLLINRGQGSPPGLPVPSTAGLPCPRWPVCTAELLDSSFCCSYLPLGQLSFHSVINVTLGAHNIQRQERTQQHITVRRAIPHPEYNPENIQNDIMLLQVLKNRAVRPVALPQARNVLRPGALCTVTGWGLVNQNTLASRLQEVRLRVQRGQVCSQRFAFYTENTQICVGNPRERKNAFRGDSGGPLVCNNVAQGIVSYGERTGTPPAVFTRILSYLPWIKRTMGQNP
uniref:Cathepsin G n=1 Tax=Urocitellus parryii TaxID=9999 RepID=A0A8D2HD97_UROPR